MAARGLQALLEFARADDGLLVAVGDRIEDRYLDQALELLVGNRLKQRRIALERKDALDEVGPRDRGLEDDETRRRPALQDQGSNLVDERGQRRDRLLQLLRIAIGGERLRVVIIDRFGRKLRVRI